MCRECNYDIKLRQYKPKYSNYALLGLSSDRMKFRSTSCISWLLKHKMCLQTEKRRCN